MGSTPGPAARNFPKPVRVEPPKPSCDAAVTPKLDGIPILPDMMFSRENLICVRHSDGRTEQLVSNIPWGLYSATKTDLAYWVQEKQELHVFPIAQQRDAVLDSVAGAHIREMVWSANGRTLAYLLAGPSSGIHAVDLSTGRRNLFAGSFRGLIASPDPEYVMAIGKGGVERFGIGDGRHEVVVPARYADRAVYSPKGNLLGILSSTTSKFLDSPPEVAFGSAPTTDDDGPDCTGGSFNLILQIRATTQLIDVPFPPKFDTVLDFEFSPNERAIAVTFGVTGCDYPGDAARVYKVSLPELRLTPLSPADRLSAQAHWSPDGGTIVYTDYSGGPPNGSTSLQAIDVQKGRITKLTNSPAYGSDTWLGWR